MLRRERTQGFASFTHSFDILQFPMQPCSYSKKLLPPRNPPFHPNIQRPMTPTWRQWKDKWA